MFINIMSISDDERKELGFELVEVIKREKPLSNEMMNRIKKRDENRAKTEIKWEMEQIKKMNEEEKEEKRRFEIDPYYMGEGECINKNCFQGTDS